ncbi:MAG: methionine--tRNA ligase [Candidatus Omnitrophica bacterium]|nr:methionine--tRNA ligase [Candidatus Omnitrophota bacterium]
MKESYYITTPIYYVNDKPHIGHAYTTILCDTFARFNRLLGKKVFFLTGTDEHGEKVERTATSLGKEVTQHVDDMVVHFKQAWKKLNIQYDDFIRTTEARHKEVVHIVVRKLLASGDIYKGKYEGWYCVPCESFWSDVQLADKKCPDCHRAVNHYEEENFFFKLSNYQDWLKQYISEHPDFIIPKGKRQEVLSFLKDPLEDLCISRPKKRLSWGIPFPDHEQFVMYVWFDALINYISAPGYSVKKETFSSVWPADIHMIGKDILRQHAIYWPIMLKAAGIEQPRHIIAHGWWTIEGSKVSKSRGNIVDPINMAAMYGVDTFRYYMLREASIGSDGAYSEELLIRRFNSDLANDLGNLVYRSLSMGERYFKGVIPAIDPQTIVHPIREHAEQLGKKLEKAINEEFDPRAAIGAIWDLISDANKYVEDSKPWQLKKDTSKEHQLREFMYTLLEVIRFIGIALTPFLPETAEKILFLLKESKVDAAALNTWGVLQPGRTLEKGQPLFPKIEDTQ